MDPVADPPECVGHQIVGSHAVDDTTARPGVPGGPVTPLVGVIAENPARPIRCSTGCRQCSRHR